MLRSSRGTSAWSGCVATCVDKITIDSAEGDIVVKLDKKAHGSEIVVDNCAGTVTENVDPTALQAVYKR